MPIIYDGKEWRHATKEEYENVIINVPVYGKANYIVPTVWDLPIVDTDVMTGSKVVKCGRSVQFRFSCARTTDTAQAVRAYKLALDKDERAGVQFNYSKTGSVIERLSSLSSIKSVLVRMRQEETQETSNFKKFTYNNFTLGVIRYLRDTLDIKGYNNLKVSQLEVVPSDNIYGIKVTFKK